MAAFVLLEQAHRLVDEVTQFARTLGVTLLRDMKDRAKYGRREESRPPHR